LKFHGPCFESLVVQLLRRRGIEVPLDLVGARVARRDVYGGRGVDHVPLVVRDATLAQELEKDVVHLRMGFPQFVQEDDRIGATADALREPYPLRRSLRIRAALRSGRDRVTLGVLLASQGSYGRSSIHCWLGSPSYPHWTT
jgi:hypothetical protein